MCIKQYTVIIQKDGCIVEQINRLCQCSSVIHTCINRPVAFILLHTYIYRVCGCVIPADIS